jgi:hypothetical protein
MSARCLWCGARAVEFHHLTGRDWAEKEYLDPALTVPLCIGHHAAEHVVLRRLELDQPTEATPMLAHRLRRFGVAMGRAHDLDRCFVLRPAASRAGQLLILEAADRFGGLS